MIKHNQSENCVFGITGASGALGKALTSKLRSQGNYVIGITHRENIRTTENSKDEPQEWISWKCGEENKLENILKKIDILILNHGINSQGLQNKKAIDQSLEVNALSNWRIIKLFEEIAFQRDRKGRRMELWINSSEAEIQPALSPTYELSKRLIGQLVSLRWNNLNEDQRKKLCIRKLILGPFKSDLNPIGIMNPNFVANAIIWQARIDCNLIIVSPNPITYLIMPLVEFSRKIYFYCTSLNNKKE